MSSTRTVRSGSIRRVRDKLVVRFRERVRERALSCGIPPTQFRDWVDEVVGEGISVALKSLDLWDEERGDFLTWAYLKTTTLIRDELRREKRRYEHYDRLGQGRIGEIPSDLPDIVTKIAMREQLLELFGSLSADQTNALILHYLLGYSVKEIADITGKPDATVYTLLLRGRKRLNRDRQDP